MSRNYTCSIGWAATVSFLCLVFLAPERSAACSCVCYYPTWGFVSGGGLIPSNSPGLLWWGEFEGSNGTDRALPVQPVVFVIHVIEEAPAFVPWFNSLVEPDITEPLFLSVNGVAFLITIVLSGILAAIRERAIAVVDLAWLGFLMFANALLHLTATVVHHRYSPGVITAACLYLPYFVLLFAVVLRRLRVSWGVALSATVLGALPMAAHGYLIVFRGSRLF